MDAVMWVMGMVVVALLAGYVGYVLGASLAEAEARRTIEHLYDRISSLRGDVWHGPRHKGFEPTIRGLMKFRPGPVRHAAGKTAAR